jgi:hypothetical protein
MSETVKVGDKIWLHRGESYRYRDGEKTAWESREITGETARSWLVGKEKWSQEKIPKKNADARVVAFSEADVDRACWLRANQYRLGEAVSRSRDLSYDHAIQIAHIVGYKERAK